MYRHVRQSCKIATSDEGMDQLMEHTLQRQMSRMEEQNAAMAAQLAKLAEMLEKQPLAIPPSQHVEGSSTIVNGPVTQTRVTQTQVTQNINFEIKPWDDARAVIVNVREIAAAFAENSRLREYARLPEHQLTDPEVAPPYVAELFTDLLRRAHGDPTARNVYLNPRRADQVLIHLRDGSWQVRTFASASQALLDGVAISIHEVTLTEEKRRQLPLEAQNALAMADLVYNDEPEAYVERTRGPIAAHLTNLAPPRRTLHP